MPGKAKRKKEKAALCAELKCNKGATTEQYCRFHYLIHWKLKKKIVQLKGEEKLNKYVEQLVKKYPDSHLEVLRKELAGEEDILSLMESVEESDLEELDHSYDDDALSLARKFEDEE